MGTVRKMITTVVGNARCYERLDAGPKRQSSTSVCSCYGLLKDCERKHFYGNK